MNLLHCSRRRCCSRRRIGGLASRSFHQEEGRSSCSTLPKPPQRMVGRYRWVGLWRLAFVPPNRNRNSTSLLVLCVKSAVRKRRAVLKSTTQKSIRAWRPQEGTHRLSRCKHVQHLCTTVKQSTLLLVLVDYENADYNIIMYVYVNAFCSGVMSNNNVCALTCCQAVCCYCSLVPYSQTSPMISPYSVASSSWQKGMHVATTKYCTYIVVTSALSKLLLCFDQM